MGGSVAFPVLDQVVARDVGLVSHADERGQAEPALVGQLDDRNAQRAALRQEAEMSAGGKTGENDALSRTLGSVFSRPMQFGPTIRIP